MTIKKQPLPLLCFFLVTQVKIVVTLELDAAQLSYLATRLLIKLTLHGFRSRFQLQIILTEV